jgi:dTDP-4-amino-4,6-dideoxygalactose transaminase
LRASVALGMARDGRDVVDLALFGGGAAFPRPKSIGSLAQPAFDRFMAYSRLFFDEHRFANEGPCNRLLEARLADFHHAARSVTFSSAFWGLALAMRCLALSGRTEVVMPSLTYRRMGEIAALAGLIPRFCEVDPVTLGQTAETVAPCLNSETALIVGVHPTVNCGDATGLEKLSAATGIPLLFDSVESTYETCDGRKVGCFGRAEGFSLHASKLINGFEGGYITSDDHELADRLAYMRGFGFAAEDTVVEFGINAKLNEIHAAMALASLDELEDLVRRNRVRYDAYRRGLATVRGISVREFDERERCSFKNVVVELDDSWPLTRGQTLEILHAEGALARPYYWPALHTKETGFEKRFGALPVTDYLAERFVLLPCGEQMDEDDILAVVRVLVFIAGNAEAIDALLAAPTAP